MARLTFLILSLVLLPLARLDCVMQGVCGYYKDHACLRENATLHNTTKDINDFCVNFPVDSPVCCNPEQIKMLQDGLWSAGRWFGW